MYSHCKLFLFYFSSKPVNLSFMEMMPDKVINSTPVIICHGFLGSKQNWRSLAKAIAIKSGRQVKFYLNYNYQL